MNQGHTLIELLVVLAIVGILATFWTTDIRKPEKAKEFENFAMECVQTLEACRWKAMNERAYAGVILQKTQGAYAASLYVDGNRNGIRLADVSGGIDSRFRGPIRLAAASGDIMPGILDEDVPQIPPKTGLLDQKSDPVKFGKSDIISFSPNGDSSSGTLYLECRSLNTMYAIVLYGATARLKLWKYCNHEWQTVGDR